MLKIGPGPGYLNLEWLKRSKNFIIYWLEISDNMIKLAEANSEKYVLNRHYAVSKYYAKSVF